MDSQAFKSVGKRISSKHDRLETRQVKELERVLRMAARQVKEEIYTFEEAAPLSQGQAARLAQMATLKGAIDRIASALERDLTGTAPDHTRQAFRLGMLEGVSDLKYLKIPDYAAVKAGEANALVDIVFTTIDKDALDFFIKYRMQLMGSLSEQLQYEIKTRIAAGIVSGKSTPEMVREIGKVIDDKNFKKAGKTVFKSTQQRLRLICRTEINRAHNAGRVAFYKEAGVKKVQWWAAHDRRTCPGCASKHRQVYRTDKVEPPPSHPLCRCVLIAVK